MTLLIIRISALAGADLTNIGRYTARQWGIAQRNSSRLRFDERFKILSANPNMGHCCEEIRKGYQRFREGEHVIFYCLTEKTLDIIRILHKNIDIEQASLKEIIIRVFYRGGAFIKKLLCHQRGSSKTRK